MATQRQRQGRKPTPRRTGGSNGLSGSKIREDGTMFMVTRGAGMTEGLDTPRQVGWFATVGGGALRAAVGKKGVSRT